MFKNRLIEMLLEKLVDHISPEEHDILNKENVENISDKLRENRRTNRLSSTLKPSGVGSSREYYKQTKPSSITIDGNKTSIETGIKVAYNGKFGTEIGLKQNENETRNLSKHQIIRKDENGDYHTNENGVILPTLDHDKNHKWVQVPHIEPLSGKTKLEDYTKTPEHPNGLTNDDIEKTFVLGKHHVDSHPFIQAVRKFADENNIAHADIHHENIGIFTHPVTGKKYPVLHDHGVTNGLLSGS